MATVCQVGDSSEVADLSFRDVVFMFLMHLKFLVVLGFWVTIVSGFHGVCEVPRLR